MVELSIVGRRIASQSFAIEKSQPLKRNFQSVISQHRQSAIAPPPFALLKPAAVVRVQCKKRVMVGMDSYSGNLCL